MMGKGFWMSWLAFLASSRSDLAGHCEHCIQSVPQMALPRRHAGGLKK